MLWVHVPGLRNPARPLRGPRSAGAGGMGEVYRARDTRLDRTVAIKVLPAHLASSPELRQRMEREARAISSLNHPNICTLHDIGHQDGLDYLVMEVLHAASESVSELSPSLWLRDGEPGCTRHAATPVQGAKLPNPVRETAIATGSSPILKARSELGAVGPSGAAAERHRLRPEDDRSQGAAAAPVQDRITGSTQIPVRPSLPEGRGNAGAVESVENQTQVFPASHRPLEISQERRDSHISTAPATIPMAYAKYKNQRKEVGRYAPSAFFSYLPSASCRQPLSCSSFDSEMLHSLMDELFIEKP